MDKDLNEESIDCFVVNRPDSEEIDFVGKESKAKIEIEPKRWVVKNKSSEKLVDIAPTFQEKEAESEFETETEIATDEPGLEVFSFINMKTCKVGSTKDSRKHERSLRDSGLAINKSK